MSRSAKRGRWSFGKIIVGSLGAFLMFELAFIAWVWPDWAGWRKGEISESALIRDYRDRYKEDPRLPRLHWSPLRKSLPQAIKKVFIVAEDSRFYEHKGIDYQALRDAIIYNYQHGKILLGASTISQQTAKNMFLSLSRNPLRKWHELLLTYLLEFMLKKNEILHIYLNVAEFGKGIYGIEAAARSYYGMSAYQLSQGQAAELAATLPSPKKNNPRKRTRPFQRRVQRIAHTLRAVDQFVAQQPRKQGITDEASKLELARKLDELRRAMEVESAAEVMAGEPSISPSSEGEANGPIPSTDIDPGLPEGEKTLPVPEPSAADVTAPSGSTSVDEGVSPSEHTDQTKMQDPIP